jgi:protein-S-isoprenylcysteine O-methyltransferase Ste14
MLISFFGFGLALNSWISLVLVTVPVSFAMIHRMNIEEDFLVAHFGESYTTYMKKTCRIIPYIY